VKSNENDSDKVQNDVLVSTNFKNERLLSSILESSSSVSIISTDINHNIQYWNNGAENIFGYKSSEVIGKNISIIYDGNEARKEAQEVSKKIFSTKQQTECELRQITKNGEHLWSRMTLTPRFDEDDKMIGILGLGIEITQYKNLEHDLRDTLTKLKTTLTGIIYATELIIETRDPYTAGHQRRVALLAKAIATNMKLSEQQVEGIYMVGMIHDVGKISIPAEILSMPRLLTTAEFNLIKSHPQSGYDILKNIDFPWPIANIILQHHERIDGSGYPKGLTGNDIMLEAKILMVADVVEAMASHRPYRAAFPIDNALDEIKKYSGIYYQPDIVNSCIEVFKKENFNFEISDKSIPILADINVLPKM